MSVRYSTLSEQLWSKSTLGATLERTPPVKAPDPMGPPEPAIPGSGRIGRQVAGLTATARAEPKDHTSQRALRPWCSTSGQLVGPPDKPCAPRDAAGCRGTREPGSAHYHISRTSHSGRDFWPSLGFPLSGHTKPGHSKLLTFSRQRRATRSRHALQSAFAISRKVPPPSSRMRFPTCKRAVQPSTFCSCPPNLIFTAPPLLSLHFYCLGLLMAGHLWVLC